MNFVRASYVAKGRQDLAVSFLPANHGCGHRGRVSIPVYGPQIFDRYQCPNAQRRENGELHCGEILDVPPDLVRFMRIMRGGR